jgi:hypothetical protein
VQRVLVAERTILLELNPRRMQAFVLLVCVIAPFAVGAFKDYDFTHWLYAPA